MSVKSASVGGRKSNTEMSPRLRKQKTIQNKDMITPMAKGDQRSTRGKTTATKSQISSQIRELSKKRKTKGKKSSISG